MVQVQYVILEGDIETMINTTNIFDYEDVQLILTNVLSPVVANVIHM